MKKRPEREEARELYRQGRTYNEIMTILQASKSTVSLWCRDLVWAKKAAIAARPEKVKETRERARALPPYQDYHLYVYADRVQLVHAETRARLVFTIPRYDMSIRLRRQLTKDEVVVTRPDGEIILTNYIEQGLARRVGRDPRPCVICEEVFTPRRKGVETCSRACRSILVSGIQTGRKRMLPKR